MRTTGILLLPCAAAPVEIDRHLVDARAEDVSFARSSALQAKPVLSDEVVAVAVEPQPEDRGAIDPEERRDRRGLEAEPRRTTKPAAGSDAGERRRSPSTSRASTRSAPASARSSIAGSASRSLVVSPFERDDERSSRAPASAAAKPARNAAPGPWFCSSRTSSTGIGPRYAATQLARPVCRAVVDDDQPAAPGEQLRPALEVREQARNVLGLVVDRHHEHERRLVRCSCACRHLPLALVQHGPCSCVLRLSV